MKRLALAVVAASAVVCARAEAAVYTFVPTTIGPSPLPFVYTPADATFTLGISDAAVALGSFSYDYRYTVTPSGIPGFVATGDVQDLLFYQDRSVRVVSGGGPGALPGETIHIDLQFTPSGNVRVGQLLSTTDSYGIDISGSGGLFNGTFYIGSLPSDSVTGRFASYLPTEVPEPAASGVLVAALAGVAFVRRRTN